MNRKKWPVWLVIAALLVNMIPSGVFAEGAGENEVTDNYVTGYLSGDFSGFETPAEAASGGMRKSDEDPLPAYYSSVSEGRIREDADNQNPYGTCWAFALNSVAETTLKANEKLDYFPRLSVLQEVAFCYDVAPDPLGNTEGDSIVMNYPTGKSVLDIGGMETYTMISMSQWDNGALDKTLPYSEPYFTSLKEGTLDRAYNFDYDVARVKDFHILNTAELSLADQITAVKELVLEFGAATIAYGHYNSYVNATYGTYCCTSSLKAANHLVTLVGWNDSYPKENFGDGVNDIPEGNGAWLIKNSWGDYAYSTTSDPENTDEATDRQGYFWLSYYDRTIDTIFTVPEYESAGKYTYNYMYDGTISYGDPVTVEPGASVGALYKVKGLTSDREKVDGVSFITGSADLKVELKVIAGTTEEEPLGNADSQTVTTTYSAKYPGLHTIEIEGPSLGKDEGYTILLTFPEGGTVYVDDDLIMEDGMVDCRPDCSNDLTFDCAAGSTEANFRTDLTYRIKGLTNDAYKVELMTDSRIAGTELSPVPIAGGTQVLRSGTVELTAPDAPEGYKFTGWYADYTAKSSPDPVTTEKILSVTVSPEDSGKTLHYTAVYSVNASASLNLTVTADAYTVSLNGAEAAEYTDEQELNVKPGAAAALTYAGEAGFLYWADENGNVLSRKKTLTVSAVTSLNIHAVTSANEPNGSTAAAFVVFTDGTGRIIYARYWGNGETITLPAVPEGYEAWSLTGRQIKARMTESSLITVAAE